MSRILVLTRNVPYPPNSGDRIVTYGFLHALHRSGHDVHLLAYGSDDEQRADALRSICTSITLVSSTSSTLSPLVRKLVRGVSGRSDVMAMFYAEAFRDALAERVRTLNPDAVLAEHPYMGQFFRESVVERALETTGARPITNAHVIEYVAHEQHREYTNDLRTRMELVLEIPNLRREELAVYNASERVLVLGEEDRAELEDRVAGPVCNQRVALDISAYQTGSEVNTEMRISTKEDGATGSDEVDASTSNRPDEGVSTDDEGSSSGTSSRTTPNPNRLIFFGSYNWFPNEDAVFYCCRRLLPRIREERPQTELVIAGRDATDEIRALGDRPGVRFVGAVEDLESLVRSAAVVLAPLRIGGGVRLKVLESMAWGKPVVATARGFEGVEADPGEHILVAANSEDFVSKTVHLLKNPDERHRVGHNARRLIEERYAISSVSAELETNLGI